MATMLLIWSVKLLRRFHTGDNKDKGISDVPGRLFKSNMFDDYLLPMTSSSWAYKLCLSSFKKCRNIRLIF